MSDRVPAIDVSGLTKWYGAPDSGVLAACAVVFFVLAASVLRRSQA